jgi:uncharacterized protein (DUF58 family)
LLELRHQAHTFGLASHHLVNTTFAGTYASVFRGQGLNFEEVREYREGDDIRNMDWKVTARINEPHLKVYREERERSVVLCVDKGPHMHFGTRGTFKYIQAARATALLGWAANTQGDRVGGILFGDVSEGIQHYRPTKDRRALWRLLHDLAEPSSRATLGEDSLERILKRADRGAGTGALVFVIADFNERHSRLDRALGQLAQRHTVVLIPVDDEADQDLPAVGRVLFRAPDGRLLEIDANDPAGRERYRTDWRERRDNLKTTASRLGVSVIPIATHQDVHRSLMDGLRRHARARG